MSSLLKNMVLSALFFSLLAPNLLSCYSVNQHVYSEKRVHNSVPIDSFVEIRVVQTLKPVSCHESSEDIKKCHDMLGQLPNVESKSIGSGILIVHKGKNLILTAAHVCIPGTINLTKYKGSVINLSSEYGQSLIFQDGKKIPTKIIKIDKKLDLCTLEAPKKISLPKPVHLSPSPPKRGDKIINIAAPLGLTSKKMVLVFDGRYAGARAGWHYYTVPARPGSSGSIVLNERYQAVGTVNVAVINFESVGIGSGWAGLKWFLDSH